MAECLDYLIENRLRSLGENADWFGCASFVAYECWLRIVHILFGQKSLFEMPPSPKKVEKSSRSRGRRCERKDPLRFTCPPLSISRAEDFSPQGNWKIRPFAVRIQFEFVTVIRDYETPPIEIFGSD